MKKANISIILLFSLFLVFTIRIAVTKGASTLGELPLRYWSQFTTIFNSPEEIDLWLSYPSAVEDKNGNLHAVWSYYSSEPYLAGIMYSMRDLNGNWSLPKVLHEGQASNLAVVSDFEGTVYVVFQGQSFFVMELQDNGSWLQSQEFPGVILDDLSMEEAPDGTLYIIGAYPSHGLYPAPYLQKLPGEEWALQEFPSREIDIVFDVDFDGRLHVAYYNGGIQYFIREPNQEWSTSIPIGDGTWKIDELVAETIDEVHLAWVRNVSYPCPPLTCTKYELQYAILEQGVLSTIEVIDEFDSPPPPNQLAPIEMVVAQDTVHLAWVDSDQAHYAYRTSDGNWEVDENARPAQWLRLFDGPGDEVHFYWSTEYCTVYHQWKWKSVASEWSVEDSPVPHGICNGSFDSSPSAHFFTGKDAENTPIPQAVYVRRPNAGSSEWLGVKHRFYIPIESTLTSTPSPTASYTPTSTPTPTIIPSSTPTPRRELLLPFIMGN